MNYGSLEDAIVSRLEPLRALGFEVIALPDNNADYERPFRFGRVTVAYKGSMFNDDGMSGRPMVFSTSEVVQKETAEIEVVVQARFIRSNQGIYKLVQHVFTLLLGYEPDSWGRLYGREHRYVEHADGIWTYSITLFSNALRVQRGDPETLPVLQQVTVFLGDDPATVISVNSDMAAPSIDPQGAAYVFQTGTAFSLKYEFVTPTNQPANLTGYTFRWAIKRFLSDPDPLILKSPDADNNVVYGTLSGVENALVPGTYKTILEVTNPSLVVEQEIVNTIVIEPQAI